MGNILRCVANGDVNGYSKVGGLIGEFRGGNIQNSFAHGYVHEAGGPFSDAGGFIGLVDAYGNTVILMCAADGNIDGTRCVGGFVGALVAEDDISVNISRCYGFGDVSGQDGVGGFIGLVKVGDGGDE